MVFEGSELLWYERNLNPLIKYFTERHLCVQRIAICETAEAISIICDSRIIVTMDNKTFNLVYCDNSIIEYADELCEMVHRFCIKLDRFNYKIRQIVIHSPHQRWGNGLLKGEVVRSVDKIGEKVVMLTCR